MQRKSRLGKINRAAQKGKPHKLQGFTGITDKCKQEMQDKAEAAGYKGFSPDHIRDCGLGGHPTSGKNLRWMSSDMNEWIGSSTGNFDPAKGHTGIDVSNCCS